MRRPGPSPPPVCSMSAVEPGDFLREVKANYPRLFVTGLDLSPHYLDVARRELKPWSRVRLVEGAAEAMPFADAEFDVVTCIYLFHELPPRIRRAVAAEIRRVLHPGGTLIFVDSLQTGDDPDYDAMLELFPLAFHEPYYASYLREDFDRLLSPGFTPGERLPAYFSKVLSYRRDADECLHPRCRYRLASVHKGGTVCCGGGPGGPQDTGEIDGDDLDARARRVAESNYLTRGIPTSEIGRRMGLTKNTIIGRLHRNGDDAARNRAEIRAAAQFLRVQRAGLSVAARPSGRCLNFIFAAPARYPGSPIAPPMPRSPMSGQRRRKRPLSSGAVTASGGALRDRGRRGSTGTSGPRRSDGSSRCWRCRSSISPAPG